MTDIVERLRKPMYEIVGLSQRLCEQQAKLDMNEAADEIERLRSEVSRLLAAVERADKDPDWSMLKDASDEIKRLRFELKLMTVKRNNIVDALGAEHDRHR